MQVVIYSRKHRVVHAKGFIKQWVFVPLAVAGTACIHLVVKFGIRHVEFKRGYTNDRPILFMEFNELEGILAIEDKVVVEFIPSNRLFDVVKT